MKRRFHAFLAGVTHQRDHTDGPMSWNAKVYRNVPGKSSYVAAKTLTSFAKNSCIAETNLQQAAEAAKMAGISLPELIEILKCFIWRSTRWKYPNQNLTKHYDGFIPDKEASPCPKAVLWALSGAMALARQPHR